MSHATIFQLFGKQLPVIGKANCISMLFKDSASIQLKEQFELKVYCAAAVQASIAANTYVVSGPSQVQSASCFMAVKVLLI